MMPSDGEQEKISALRQAGALNPRSEDVVDGEFLGSEFFDARDLVQVKYEMLRRVRVARKSVKEAASSFGLSRTTYYEAAEAMSRSGLPGLLPQRPGPRRAHKVTDDVLQFVEQILLDHKDITMKEVARRVHDHLGVSVHPRSLERALVRRKKKRHPEKP